MIRPDKKNVRTFRIMLLVGFAAAAFAIWLMIHANTAPK